MREFFRKWHAWPPVSTTRDRVCDHMRVKTRRKRGTSVLIISGLVALVSACAAPPTATVDAARAGVEAVAAEGQVYAPQAYAAARTAVGRLDAELQAQNDRFALTRSYDRVTQLAAEVQTAADTVGAAIEAEQERLQTETRGLVADAEAALDAVRPAIDELDDEDAAGLRADVEDVESALAAVASDLQAGEYTDANQGARSAQSAARDIGSALAAMAVVEETVDEDVATRAVRGGFDLPRRAYATGQPLEPGPYRVRLTDESAPVIDQEPPTTTRWVEFLHEEDGAIAARALATVVPDSEMAEIAVDWVPRNQVRVDELRGGDYVRVWLNRTGSSYLVHMPTSAP